MPGCAVLLTALHQLNSARYFESRLVPGGDLLVYGSELLDNEEILDEMEQHNALFHLFLQQMRFDLDTQKRAAWDDAHQDALDTGRTIVQDQKADQTDAAGNGAPQCQQGNPLRLTLLDPQHTEEKRDGLYRATLFQQTPGTSSERELRIANLGIDIPKPGVVAIVPANSRHSVRALTDGRLIVVDHPVRPEFG